MRQRGVPRYRNDEVVAGSLICARKGGGAQVPSLEVAVAINDCAEAGDVGDGRGSRKIFFLALHEIGPGFREGAGLKDRYG